MTDHRQGSHNLCLLLTACLVNCFKVGQSEQGLPGGRLSVRIVAKEVSDVPLNARFKMAVGSPFLELLEREKHNQVRTPGIPRPSDGAGMSRAFLSFNALANEPSCSSIRAMSSNETSSFCGGLPSSR